MYAIEKKRNTRFVQGRFNITIHAKHLSQQMFSHRQEHFKAKVNQQMHNIL